MQINNASAEYNSLYHLALRWARATSTDFPFNPDFLQGANLALSKVSALIMRFDNTWEQHDTNASTLPISTTALASGQAIYALSTSHLKMLRVRVKDRNGNFYTVPPKSRGEIPDSELDGSGEPRAYDKLGRAIIFSPTPDYDAAAGVEIQWQGGADPFETSDTTKEPGFNPLFHELIGLYPALEYCEINDLDSRAKKIRDRIGQEPRQGVEGTGLLGDLADFYSSRDADRPQSISIDRSNRGIGTLL